MFVQLVVSTLILGSVVAVPPPTAPSTIPPTTEDPTLELSNSSLQLEENPAAAMTSLRCTFMDYEEYIKLFLDNIKADGQPLETLTSGKLFEELRPYIAKLPKAETRLVTRKYREKCWCDGSMKSPCPEKCMNSCRMFTNSPTFPWYNKNDCETVKSRLISCYCYEGSSTRCNYGNLSNCYEERTEEELVNTTCSYLHADEKAIEQNLSRFFNYVMGPLKEELSRLTKKLSSFKRAVMASDSLFNFTYASCCEKQDETQCYPEASIDLKKKLSQFVRIKESMTTDMYKLQENNRMGWYNLKMISVSSFERQVKEYECCLKGWRYYNLSDTCAPEADSTLPSPPLPPSPPSPTTS